MTWQRVRLRYVAEFNPAPSGRLDADSGDALPLYRMEAINEFSPPAAPELRPIEQLSSGYSFVDRTDVAYAKVTPCFENGKGVVGSDLDGPSFATTEVTVLRPSSSLDQRFLTYFLQSSDFRAVAIGSMTGAGGLKRVSESQMRDYSIPLPPLEEQRRIADYLDHETTQIDSFINDLERFRTLTLEHREAYRDRALLEASRGQSIPLKYLARVTVGIVVTPSRWYVEEGGIPALRGLNVSPDAISTDDMVWISEEGNTLHAKSRLDAGDVVVVRTGQTGAAAVVPRTLDGCNAIDLLIVKPRPGLCPEFLTMFLNSNVAKAEIGAQNVGAIQAHFNVEALKNLEVPRIGLEQQERIAASWQRERDGVVDLRADVEKAIDLARERRSALISAAVTGQLDVSSVGVGV